MFFLASTMAHRFLETPESYQHLFMICLNKTLHEDVVDHAVHSSEEDKDKAT